MRKACALVMVAMMSLCGTAYAGTAIYTGSGDAVQFPPAWGDSATTVYTANDFTFAGAPGDLRGIGLPTDNAGGIITDVPPSDFELSMVITSAEPSGGIGIAIANAYDPYQFLVLSLNTSLSVVRAIFLGSTVLGSTEIGALPLRLRMTRTDNIVVLEKMASDDAAWVSVATADLAALGAADWFLSFAVAKYYMWDTTSFTVDEVYLTGPHIPSVNEYPVVYVDKDNVSGIENGTTWATAFTTVQEGIDAAFADGGGDVWVAGGVYDEQRVSVMHIPAVDTGSLVMREGIHLYGGFAGTEIDRSERDWEVNTTIIDGSTSRSGEAAYHVVVGANDATLDGFTVTGGQADGEWRAESVCGGGMYNRDSACPSVANCTFTNNLATNGGAGGGMYNRDNACPTVTNCTFTGNRGDSGGGMYNRKYAWPTVTECVFESNSAHKGGGILNASSSGATVRDCVFLNNWADGYDGGAIYNDVASPPVTNCTFSGNSAGRRGGAICNDSCFPSIVNCVFLNNSADWGGAVHNDSSEPTMTNCTFAQNVADCAGGALYNITGSEPRIVNSILWDNSPDEIYDYESSEYPAYNASSIVTYSDVRGGFSGEGNLDIDPLFISAVSADYRLRPDSPCLDSGTLTDAPLSDMLGVPRPQFGGVDMGAYELPEQAVDWDEDTIPDSYEGADDPDEDGLSNFEDPDSDGDGIPDALEGIGDADGDGIPSYLDLQSDTDGLSDEYEGSEDPDNDGVPNFHDLDSDGDGFWDAYEGSADPDGDGIPSYLDIDSDGDGVPDAEDPFVVYVDKDNTSGIEDGVTWATAFTTVQAGIDTAVGPGFSEVWVAEGVYDEVRDNDTGSVIMEEYVDLYGGFAGNETARNQRDWETHVTVLDGSIARTGEAAYHVVIGADSAVLDGFTITGGNAHVDDPERDDPRLDGGGMYNFDSSPTVINCTFTGNAADENGGGMYNGDDALPLIQGCTFTNNLAEYGGGMFNRETSPTVADCLFSDNWGYKGGGIYNDDASPTVVNCTFSANGVPREDRYDYCDGAGMFNSYGSPAVTNCTFVDNQSYHGGGMYNYRSTPTVTHCAFIDNFGSDTGGAMHNSGGTVTLASCMFADNFSHNKGAGMISAESTLSATNCVFTGNTVGVWGGGMFLYGGDTTLTNCSLSDNTADYGGAIYVDADRPPQLHIRNCIMWGNSTGQIMSTEGFEPTIEYSDIQDGYDGIGNIDVDPMFFHALSGDLRVRAGSACIDAGTSDGAPDADILGAPRPQGAGVDMGAYEFPIEDDEDGDTLPDIYEGTDDPDGDGVTNQLDLDSDGDGLLDSDEGIADVDGDGLPNYLDPDSDDDTIPDTDEGLDDPDGDGWQNYIDIDSDGDGHNDVYEGTDDWDGDGSPNFLDLDRDGDGVPDSETTAVVYVNKNNRSPARDGRTWPTAYTTIQEGIDLAFGAGGGEVWVARGVYNELRTSIMHDERVDTGSLVMKEGVHVYGGFTGTETQREQRNWRRRETVIDGSTSRGGLPAYHVVVGANDATLDGFTVTGGNADGDFDLHDRRLMGGGMHISGTSPTIANCTLTNNTAGYGGGMYSTWRAPEMSNCTFTANTARLAGGGMHTAYLWSYSDVPVPTVDSCTFSNNSTAGDGGGIYTYNRDMDYYFIMRHSVTNCTFSGNSAEGNGGAMYIDSEMSRSPMVLNCAFTGNSAEHNGGAIYVNKASEEGGFTFGPSSPVVNCLFQWNVAQCGGGMYIDMRKCLLGITLLNCTFEGNAAEYGGGLYRNNTDAFDVEGTAVNCIFWNDSPQEIVSEEETTGHVVTFSDIQGGYPDRGNIDADPRFVDAAAGNLRLCADSPCIDAAVRGYLLGLGVREDFEGDPRGYDGTAEPRGDGYDYDMGADEYVPDTDGDGLGDWRETGTGIYVDETDTGTDPASPDTDGDGLSDGDEVMVYLTNPLSADTDGDGYRDDSEVMHGSDPLDSTSRPVRGGSGGPCFIATAAYGSPAARDVGLLRDFRDSYLLTNRVGAAFVRAYYRLSPPVARYIARHGPMRTVVRTCLTPVIAILRLRADSRLGPSAMILIAVSTVGALGLVSLRKGAASGAPTMEQEAPARW